MTVRKALGFTVFLMAVVSTGACIDFSPSYDNPSFHITVTPRPTIGQTSTSPLDDCDPAYPTICLNPPPPDLDCQDIEHRSFKVLPPDKHYFDEDGDGIGCEDATYSGGQTFSGQPSDFSNYFNRADIVVGGTVVEVFDAQWTTEDKKPPVTITKEIAQDLSVHIRTPVQLEVEKVYKGNPDDTLIFSFVGGQVGDTVQSFEWNEVIQKNARLILFLAKGDDDSPAHRVDAGALFPQFHLLVKNGIAQGPVAEIPLDELDEQLR